MNEDIKYLPEALETKLRKIFCQNDMTQLTQSEPELLEYLESNWIYWMKNPDHIPALHTYSDNGLPRIIEEWTEGRLSLTDAVKSIRTGSFSFGDRWDFAFRARSVHSELWGWNIRSLVDLMPYSDQGSLLCINLLEYTIQRIESKNLHAYLSSARAHLYIERFRRGAPVSRKSIEDLNLVDILQAALIRVNQIHDPIESAYIQRDLGTIILLSAQLVPSRVRESIMCFNYALTVFTRDHYPYERARTIFLLGRAFSKLSNQKKENIQKSSCYYLEALEILTETDYPEDYATVSLNLGLNYLESEDNRAHTIDQGINQFHHAWKIYNRKTFRRQWAINQYNLGHAYFLRINGIHRKNIEKSIHYCNKALELLNPRTDQRFWVMAKQQIAQSLRERIRGCRSDNIEKAIEHLNDVLCIIMSDQYPDWATTQFILGTLFQRQIKGDPGENVEQTIHYYLTARDQYEKYGDFENRAKCEINLGAAYPHRVKSSKKENLDLAIGCIEQALMFFDRVDHPATWATLMINLSSVYQTPIGEKKFYNLSKALEACHQALEIFTLLDYPRNWAIVQSHLGDIYRKMARTDSQCSILAIQSYQNALRYITQDDDPINWAKIKYHLTILYVENPSLDPCFENALSSIADSLIIHRLDTLPVEARASRMLLGKIHILRNDYPKAIAAFRYAAEADANVQKSYHVLPCQTDAEMESSSNLYFHCAWCMIQLKRYPEAVEWLERGKARALSQAICLNRARFEELPQVYKDNYETMLEQLKGLEAEYSDPKRPAFEIIQEVRNARHRLDELIADIRKIKPEFLTFEIAMEAIYTTIPDENTTIIEYNITEFGTGILLMTRRDSVVQYDAVIVNEFDVQRLNRYMRDWYTSYASLSVSQKVFFGQDIHDIMDLLSPYFLKPLVPRIQEWRTKKILIIPHLSQHLLPMHIMPYHRDGEQRYLIDDFEVSVAPSLKVLHQIRHANPLSIKKFVGISDPDSNLPYALSEIRTIISILGSNTHAVHFSGVNAIAQSVLAEIIDADIIHFACHSFIDPGNPLRSYIGLADGTKLSLIDISRAIFKSSPLVLLATCASGKIVSDDKTDEFIGFPSAFLYAGSRAVISTLWEIDDQSTRTFMEHLYTIIRTSPCSFSSALRQAILTLRQTHSNPFFWAAYQVTGLLEV